MISKLFLISFTQRLVKLRITILKYHSWYLCQISLLIRLFTAYIVICVNDNYRNGNWTRFAPRDQVSPFLVVYCSLFLHIWISSFTQFFIHKNCFYVLIFYFEKFSTWIWRFPFALYVKLKLTHRRPAIKASHNLNNGTILIVLHFQ